MYLSAFFVVQSPERTSVAKVSKWDLAKKAMAAMAGAAPMGAAEEVGSDSHWSGQLPSHPATMFRQY